MWSSVTTPTPPKASVWVFCLLLTFPRRRRTRCWTMWSMWIPQKLAVSWQAPIPEVFFLRCTGCSGKTAVAGCTPTSTASISPCRISVRFSTIKWQTTGSGVIATRAQNPSNVCWRLLIFMPSRVLTPICWSFRTSADRAMETAMRGGNRQAGPAVS